MSFIMDFSQTLQMFIHYGEDSLLLVITPLLPVLLLVLALHTKCSAYICVQTCTKGTEDEENPLKVQKKFK